MNTRLRRTLMASASLFILTSGSGFAQSTVQSGNPAPLDDITVTVSRQEEKVIDSLSTTSVTSRQQLQTQAPQRLGTAISQMPGVTTQENPNDPATAINIRGLQDFGRVAVTIDGARQNFQRSGHNANGAFFLDPAFVRRIDVTSGPVANIYGSGAIGGVVSFETVDPWDISDRKRPSLAKSVSQALPVVGKPAYTAVESVLFAPMNIFRACLVCPTES